jgi:hypothetical protein
MKTPFTRYRPTRTSDGQGGTLTAFDEGVTIWGAFEVHGNELVIVGVDAREDVKVMDEIEIKE